MHMYNILSIGKASVFVMPWVFFVGPYLHRDRDYRIGSNFWKFYLIKTSFTH